MELGLGKASTMPVKRSYTHRVGERERERYRPQLVKGIASRFREKRLSSRRSSMVLAEIFDQSSPASWREYATEKLLPECLNAEVKLIPARFE